MTVDWRQQTAAHLQNAAIRLRQWAQSGLLYAVYSGIAGMTLWPVVEKAMVSGEPAQVGAAFNTALAGLGSGLLANRLEAWLQANRHPTEDALVRWTAEQTADPTFRTDLDRILEKLDALQATAAVFDENGRTWLVETLRAEMALLGNLPRFEPTLINISTGGGAYVGGGVDTGGGPFIGRDYHHYESHYHSPASEPAPYVPPPLPADWSVIYTPGPLPPGSYLPYDPNPLFTGREPELQALAETLLGKADGPRTH